MKFQSAKNDTFGKENGTLKLSLEDLVIIKEHTHSVEWCT